jgi:hypothetical protein
MTLHPKCATLVLLLLAAAPAGDAPPLYSNDFSKAAPGKPPESEFLVLAGDFQVKDVDGGRVLELAGTPFDSFGALFGPATEQPACTVSARVWAAVTAKRVPEFGVGSNDTGGYKLWLMPRYKQLVIRKADQTVATAPYEGWKSETWTRFRLNVAKSGEGRWTVQGKAWPDGTDEPKAWAVSFTDDAEPAAGRASLWANTYSGQPVRFDDLQVAK